LDKYIRNVNTLKKVISIKPKQTKNVTKKKIDNTKIFKSDKEFKDITYLYIAFVYLDSGLYNNNYTITNQYGVTVLNQEKLNTLNNFEKHMITEVYQMTKKLYLQFIGLGLYNDKLLKQELIKINVEKISNIVYSGNKDTVINPIYLGLNMLVLYQEQVKYKTITLSFSGSSVASIVNYIYDTSPENDIHIENSDKYLDRFIKEIYKNESWYKE